MFSSQSELVRYISKCITNKQTSNIIEAFRSAVAKFESGQTARPALEEAQAQ